MRSLICCALMAVLAGLTGCAGPETAPTDESQAQTGGQEHDVPIATEDFESGEVEGLDQQDAETAEGEEPAEPPL